MVIRGRVENGVIVVDGDVSLPEGVEVSVVVPETAHASDDTMNDEERQRIGAIIDRIAALPIEGPDEPFSGADHDEVLYGKR